MIVIPLSMLSGIIFSAIGQILSPYLLILLGGLLFLNLLKLDARDLITTFIKPKMLLLLTILKLIILPLVMFSISYVIAPAMALPIVLLTGISTGLGSPFVVNFVGGRAANNSWADNINLHRCTFYSTHAGICFI